MKRKSKILIKLASMVLTGIFVIIFAIMLIINNTITLAIARNALSLSIMVTSILLPLLEKKWWKDILLCASKNSLIWNYVEAYEVPILKETYICTLKYIWEGSKREKQVQIEIKQSYTTINVKLVSDEIRSDSIISEIIEQDDVFALYYIYKTEPKAQFQNENPAQLGSAKIILDSITKENYNENLEGKYWTTSQTMGDMYLE